MDIVGFFKNFFHIEYNVFLFNCSSYISMLLTDYAFKDRIAGEEFERSSYFLTDLKESYYHHCDLLL